jgi:WD40 repeat protein
MQPVLEFKSDAYINGVAFSPDGKCLATAGSQENASSSKSSDGAKILFWNLPSEILAVKTCLYINKPEKTLAVQKDSVHRIAYSPDGKYMASVSKEEPLCLWNIENGGDVKLNLHLKTDLQFSYDVQFHPEQPNVLALASKNAAYLATWIENGLRLQPEPICRSADIISSLAFSPKGNCLAAGCYDGTTRVRNLDTKEEIQLAQPETKVMSLGFLSEDQLVTGTNKGCIQCWDLRSRLAPEQWLAHHRTVLGLLFLQDGRLASVGEDWTIGLWGPRKKESLSKENIPGFGIVGAFDRKQLFRYDDTVIYRIPFNEDEFSLEKFAQAEVEEFAQLEGSVTCLAISPVDDRIAVAVEHRKVFLIDGKKQSPQETSLAVSSGIRCMAFSPTGMYLAVALSNGQVDLFDIRDNHRVATLRGPVGEVKAIAFSPDEKTIATGGDDGEVRLWDPVLGVERLTLKSASSIHSLCFSGDSAVLVAGGRDGSVQVWRTGD